METLAKKLAHNIADSLQYDTEKEEVIAYGMIALIQTIVTVLLVFIIGLILGIAAEALIVIFSVSLLRKYSGGAHASSIGLCTMSAVLYSIGAALLADRILSAINITFIAGIMVFIFGFSYFIIYKKAPVDSPNKPIRSDSKIKRMRKGSFITITIYLIITAIMLFFMYNGSMFFASYVLSLGLGILWQISSLTIIGKKLADIL